MAAAVAILVQAAVIASVVVKEQRLHRVTPASLNSKRGNSLPQRQHLLLVSGVAVCLNECTRSDGQPLSLTSSHVLHLNGDETDGRPLTCEHRRNSASRSGQDMWLTLIAITLLVAIGFCALALAVQFEP
jgi:hypothetical protein